ncbi:Rieske (2Fe-2S) protein [Halorussus litoreus]|uniref:Rieske (2Fe-2S) protein n=1 Tax=Halorussus litoreus TaxID=1710536 RepID=UPI000E243D31
MADRTRLVAAETVVENGSWLFTVSDQYGEPDEVILVPCEDGPRANGGENSGGDEVRAWVNRCTHEAQRLDRGFGAAMRNGEIICPKHGSMFDACSGYCDNGDAADTTLVDVDVTVEDGEVYLTDDSYEFAHEGSIEDGGEEVDGGDGEDGDGGTEDDRSGDEDGDDEDLPSWATDDEDDDDMPSSTSHIGL